MKKAIPAPLVAVVLAVMLLFGGYMGAYYAMLVETTIILDAGATGIFSGTVAPVYRIEPRAVEAFFWPAHHIDRCIRPAHWEMPAFNRSPDAQVI